MKRQANFQNSGKVYGGDIFEAQLNLMHEVEARFVARGIQPEWITHMHTNVMCSPYRYYRFMQLWDARVDIAFDDGTEEDEH